MFDQVLVILLVNHDVVLKWSCTINELFEHDLVPTSHHILKNNKYFVTYGFKIIAQEIKKLFNIFRYLNIEIYIMITFLWFPLWHIILKLILY